MTIEIHRYDPRSPTDGAWFLCTECASIRDPPPVRLDAAPGELCADCEAKYVAVWCRWRNLLGSAASAVTKETLASFCFEKKIQVAEIVTEEVRCHSQRFPALVVKHRDARIVFPSVAHDRIGDNTSRDQWSSRFDACHWFMPAYITGGELNAWSELLNCDEDKRDAVFERLMLAHYTQRRIARSLCMYHDHAQFLPFRSVIVEGIRAAQLGLVRAAVSTLLAPAEALLRVLLFDLAGEEIRNDSRLLARRVIERSYFRILGYRFLAANKIDWIPNEYQSLEFQARCDHLHLFLFTFQNFLIKTFFGETESINKNDVRILNRHAIMHGITPPRGRTLDVVKLIGILDAIAQIAGYTTDGASFTLYGAAHGAHTGKGVIFEPGDYISAVALDLVALTTLGYSLTSVPVVVESGKVLQDIAKNGTIRPNSK